MSEGFVILVSPEGAIDTRFGTNGWMTFPEWVDFGRIAIDDEDRILVSHGTPDGDGWVIARVHSDGALDTSFGDGGTVAVASFDFIVDGNRVLAWTEISPLSSTLLALDEAGREIWRTEPPFRGRLSVFDDVAYISGTLVLYDEDEPNDWYARLAALDVRTGSAREDLGDGGVVTLRFRGNGGVVHRTRDTLLFAGNTPQGVWCEAGPTDAFLGRLSRDGSLKEDPAIVDIALCDRVLGIFTPGDSTIAALAGENAVLLMRRP